MSQVVNTTNFQSVNTNFNNNHQEDHSDSQYIYYQDQQHPQSHEDPYLSSQCGKTAFTNLHSHVGNILNDERFQNTIVFLILTNAITMGAATLDIVTEHPFMTHIFDIVDFSFLILFTVELVLQFIYRGFNLFLDSWLCFDFVIIVVSWVFAPLQVIRAFRVIRVIRLVVRIEELRLLVQALINVAPRIFAITLLFSMNFYIFGVMFTHLFKSYYDYGYLEEDYFGRLDLTLFTLFQMTTLDSWSYITRQILAVSYLGTLLCCTFVIISSFIIINLVIAVICDAVSELQRKELEPMIEKIESEFSEKNDLILSTMERKIDELTTLVIKLSNEKKMLECKDDLL